MKKLLFVIMSLKCGGAERSLINLLNELPRERYEIDLLLFRRSGEFLSQVPEHVHILDTPKDLERLFGPISRAGALVPVKLVGSVLGRMVDGKPENGKMMFRWEHFYKKALSTLPGRYDAAIGYLEGESTYYICDFVNADRKIGWVHNDYSRLGNRSEDDLAYYRQLDALVTVSEGCEKALKECFPELKDRIHMLENITSAAAIRRQAEGPSPEVLHPGVFHIVSVGRLTPQKGFDIAVEAAHLLKEAGAAFEWLILGEGELRESLQQQIDGYGLQENVRLLGIRTNPYIYMKYSDLLVQSSRFEGKSIVVDEAKMLGVPVLITAYSTAKDQIEDGRSGWITDMNAVALAEGIRRLMQDHAQLEACSAYQLAHDYDNVSERKKYEALFNG